MMDDSNSVSSFSVAEFQFRRYQRPIQPPLQTHHGIWSQREGILLRLDQLGRVGFGEIAPLPWFGSETLAAALAFCQTLPTQLTESDIGNIPDRFPACQFGLETAWANLTQPLPPPVSPPSQPMLPFSGLLPTGEAALTAWPRLWQQGYRCFKWKIGVAGLETELGLYQQLATELPLGAQLRLDANGGLDLAACQRWLAACAIGDQPRLVEFLEQPLPPTEFAAMQQLAEQFPIPLALDESVATLAQLQTCYQQGWRGVFVIKPAIIGSPRRLRAFCQQAFAQQIDSQPAHSPTNKLDLVFSSVLEGSVARQAGLALAAELGTTGRAAGYGVTQWLAQADADVWWESLSA